MSSYLNWQRLQATTEVLTDYLLVKLPIACSSCYDGVNFLNLGGSTYQTHFSDTSHISLEMQTTSPLLLLSKLPTRIPSLYSKRASVSHQKINAPHSFVDLFSFFLSLMFHTPNVQGLYPLNTWIMFEGLHNCISNISQSSFFPTVGHQIQEMAKKKSIMRASHNRVKICVFF